MENKREELNGGAATGLSTDEFLKQYNRGTHPQATEAMLMLLMLITSALGAIIGIELIVNLGISANTSIIGALIAVLVGMIPIKIFNRFKNIHRQNIMETSISGATFAAGNVLITAMGVMWAFDEKRLIVPILIGCAMGCLVDVTVMYKLFDTPAFPASGTWPAGVATSETIVSVAQGGKRAMLLIAASLAGAVGQHLKIPMDIVGVCWIGNVWALIMFAAGLIIKGNSMAIFGLDIGTLYIPHGMMIGAGVISVLQLIVLLRKKEDNSSITYKPLKSSKDTVQALSLSAVLFVAVAVVIALLSGLYTQMSVPRLIFWILYAGLTSVIAELLIGTAAMHAGWFPGFATSLIFLVIGILLKFPPVALALLAGYKSCTGPAFADMGYDLKTGWILRGKNADPTFEKEGRKQQYIAELLGVVVAIVVVALTYNSYFDRGLIPPVSKVFAATIHAGSQPGILKNLMIWAVVGAVFQLIGGSDKQLGVLLSTGLLIGSKYGGFAALIAIVIRVVLEKKYKDRAVNSMYIAAAGFIVGSSLYSFINGTVRTFLKPPGK